jgi:hypothetical protein
MKSLRFAFRMMILVPLSIHGRVRPTAITFTAINKSTCLSSFSLSLSLSLCHYKTPQPDLTSNPTTSSTALKAAQIETSSPTTSSHPTPNPSEKPILTLDPTPTPIDLEAVQTESAYPTISIKELKASQVESANPTMSNMPTPNPTIRPILSLEPAPVPQLDLNAAQTETLSPTMSSKEIQDAQIETTSPTTANQQTPNPNISWNGGGWTLPNPTVSPVSHSQSRQRGWSSANHPH